MLLMLRYNQINLFCCPQGREIYEKHFLDFVVTRTALQKRTQITVLVCFAARKAPLNCKPIFVFKIFPASRALKIESYASTKRKYKMLTIVVPVQMRSYNMVLLNMVKT